MIYADYLSNAEANRWILDTDIAWDDVDPALALTQPELLERVRDSALIESFFPLFTPRALELLWDDVAATAVFSIQLYESYKHFHVFNQYLFRVDYRPIGDEEIVALRARNRNLRYDDATRLLFVSRARRMGLSCEQITALIQLWGGTNCAAAHRNVGRLIQDKQAEIAERVAELQNFSAQLDAVRAALEAAPPLAACRTDLSCCVPGSSVDPVPIAFVARPA